jgi:predicted nucleic acid-binding protein
MTRTYLDANVLITAFRGEGAAAQAAMQVIGDPRRVFVASQYLRLETLRKPQFYARAEEIEFMETYFAAVSLWVPSSDRLVMAALALASELDLGAMDALHAAAALEGKAEAFVTLERASKPLCRVPGMRVISLHS